MSTAEANLLQRLGAESLVVTVFAQDSFNATSSAAKENVKIKMVFIPPGGPFNATDIDTATLTKPYYLGETEVTVDQFDRFIRYCKPAYITNG